MSKGDSPDFTAVMEITIAKKKKNYRTCKRYLYGQILHCQFILYVQCSCRKRCVNDRKFNGNRESPVKKRSHKGRLII